jgi:cellobiose phosphorylase
MEPLLKEKAQIKPYIDLKISKYKRFKYPKERQENDIREYDNLSPIPEIGVLSNGYYTLLINDRGCGFSRYKDIYINRYRKITAENYGIFMYIRDIYSGKIWSNTYAPLNVKPDKYRVIFASDRIKYIREDSGIITTTEMCVVKDKNAEIRKISFENQTSKDVVLELTSYGEVIMCQNDRDIAHRSFNSMTIYSEFDEQSSTLIFTRKSRHNKDTKYYVASRMFFDNENDLKIEYETSRLHFIGRNNTTGNPNVIINRGNLSKGLGSSLDPIMSIRREIIVRAGQKESIFLSVAFGKSREQVLDIVNGFRNNFDVTVAFEMATALNNMRTGYSQLKGVQMRLYNTILKHIFQTSSNSESRKSILRKNTLDQTNLWKFSISGDLPIILIEIDAIENALILKDVLQAYEFYKSRGV